MSKRTILSMAFLCVVAAPGTSVASQQPSSLALSLERAKAVLQSQTEIEMAAERERKLGILTLVPPTYPGELIRVRVPIGELVTRASRAIGKARRNRAENAARKEVARELAEFLSKQPR